MDSHSSTKGAHGSFKSVTHQLSEKKRAAYQELGYKNYIGLTSKKGASEKIPPKILAILEKCPHSILQYEVKPGFYISLEMRSDLKKIKSLSLSAFKGALRDLKTYHQHGVVHRDISPKNLMLNDRGEVVITDFGTMSEQKAISTCAMTPSHFPMEDWRAYVNKSGVSSEDEISLANASKDYQKLYGKVCDDFAMLKVLMEQNNNMESYEWIAKYVKSEHRFEINWLFMSPSAYQAKYGDKLHLIDMLNFEADTV